MRYIPLSIALLFFLLFCNCTFCQEIDSDFIRKNLETSTYNIDPEAAAVVLFERTIVDISFQLNHYEQKVTTEKTIKILNSGAASLADVHIHYPADNDRNYVYNITGTTFNLEDGKMIATPLPKEDRYKKKIWNNLYEIDFLMPSVKEGSIITYSYVVVTPPANLLPVWYIQGKYPKLVSEYQVYHPVNVEYTSITHVHDTATECSSLVEARNNGHRFCHSFKRGIDNSSQSSAFWIRKNIRGVSEEPYVINTNKEYERIELQMTGETTADGEEHFLNSWDKVNDVLWRKDNYSKLVGSSHSFFDNVIDSISKQETSEAGKTRAIYSYVRSHFRCTSSDAFFRGKSLSPVFDNKEGSEADINVLLTAMLVQADINAAPMLLSTTASLPIIPAFPVLDRFNYMACAVTFSDSSRMFLDASDKNNTYGCLPPDCYNGYAWILGSPGTGVNLSNDMIEDKTTVGMKIYDITETSAKLEMVEKLGKIKSADARKKYAKSDKGLQLFMDEYMRQFSSNISIRESNMENEQNPDTNLVFKFTGTFKLDKSAGTYFIPATLLKTLKENSFKSTERKLPIEFPYRSEIKYYMNITLPANMEPDSVSKPVRLDYENGSMAYEKIINYNQPLHILTINVKYDLNKTTYTRDYYGSLRDFYEGMIGQNNEIITLKKN